MNKVLSPRQESAEPPLNRRFLLLSPAEGRTNITPYYLLRKYNYWLASVPTATMIIHRMSIHISMKNIFCSCLSCSQSPHQLTAVDGLVQPSVAVLLARLVLPVRITMRKMPKLKNPDNIILRQLQGRQAQSSLTGKNVIIS